MYHAEILQTNGIKRGLFHQGSCRSMPQVGQTFDIEFKCPAGKPMVLQTSTVTEAEFHRDHIFIKTTNSAYLLKILVTPAETATYDGNAA